MKAYVVLGVGETALRALANAFKGQEEPLIGDVADCEDEGWNCAPCTIHVEGEEEKPVKVEDINAALRDHKKQQAEIEMLRHTILSTSKALGRHFYAMDLDALKVLKELGVLPEDWYPDEGQEDTEGGK